MKINLSKKATALCSAFALVASALITAAPEVMAARDTDPASCVIRGDYDPKPASIVIDADTGTVLHEENADEKRHPASLVKMMTAMMIFDALEDSTLSPDDTFKAKVSGSVRATRRYSRSTWVNEGTVLSVEQAILAITVASANNISVMMAEKLAGNEHDFVKKMNTRALEIGLSSTIFKNATGLPDDGQITTARDMAKLSLYIMENYPQYYHYFSAETAEFGDWTGKLKKHNHNELVVKNDEIDGIKTGFICDAGYNLAASSNRNGHRIIGIVFGGRTPHKRNEKMVDLFDNAYQQYQYAEQKAAPLPNRFVSPVPKDQPSPS